MERKPHSPDLHPTELHLWFRAKDVLAPTAIMFYAGLCRASAHGLDAAGERDEAERMRVFAASVDKVAAAMIAWQAQHSDLVGLPD